MQDIHSLRSLRRHQSNYEGTKEKFRVSKKKIGDTKEKIKTY